MELNQLVPDFSVEVLVEQITSQASPSAALRAIPPNPPPAYSANKTSSKHSSRLLEVVYSVTWVDQPLLLVRIPHQTLGLEADSSAIPPINLLEPASLVVLRLLERLLLPASALAITTRIRNKLVRLARLDLEAASSAVVAARSSATTKINSRMHSSNNLRLEVLACSVGELAHSELEVREVDSLAVLDRIKINSSNSHSNNSLLACSDQPRPR